MSAKPADAKTLLSTYASEEVRGKLLDLRALSRLLAQCVVAPRYRPSSQLKKALSALSEEGAEVRNRIGYSKVPGQRAQKIRQNVDFVGLASLYALLELWNVEPLLDLDATEPEVVAQAIADEVLERRVLLPFLHGRELYDKFNVVEGTATGELATDKAIDLLGDSPIGVVHARRFLIGPLGLVVTPFRRDVYGSSSPFLQHSADRTVTRPHRITLKTSELAQVNAHRGEYQEVLRKLSRERSDWGGFLRAVLKNPLEDFDERSVKTMPFFLGDAFSNRELRVLLAEAVEASPLTHETVSKRPGEQVDGPTLGVGSFGDWSRAELIQALLTASDDQLWECIQNAVESGGIVVPPPEVREPVLNGRRQAGQWGTSLELGSLGLRTVSAWGEMPNLRLEELARKCWDECGTEYQEDIEWAVRGQATGSGLERVLAFLGANPVDEVVRVLFTRRKVSLNVCKEHLNLRVGPYDSDDSLVEKIMWSLGFDPNPYLRVVSEFDTTTAEVVAKLRNLPLEEVSHEELRTATSTYHAAAEKYIRSLLAFAAWALLEDHYTTDDPFTYTAEVAAKFTNKALFGDSGSGLDDMTLGQFGDRLRQLLKQLERLQVASDSHLRPQDEYPAFAKGTNLQQFPLKYRPLFLNLTESSRERILEALKRFISDFEESKVVEARRGLVHHNEELLSGDATQAAIVDFRAAGAWLERQGLAPSVAVRSRSSVDRWGRQETEYVDGNGIGHVQTGPSPFGFLGQPLGGSQVMVMPIAYFSEKKEPVVFRYAVDSEYRSYWSSFPVRPTSGDVVEEGN